MSSSSSRTSQQETNPYHVGYDQSDTAGNRRDNSICPAQRPPPPDYLMWSILSAIFCFMPTGLVAVYHAIKATDYFEAGALVEGEVAQLRSRKFIIISCAIGSIIFVVTGVTLGTVY